MDMRLDSEVNHGSIGVIVPVYKVEKYIAECIESILVQTYTNFRLILVDDGTPDNAGKICDEFAKKDSRITVIHQENAGVTRARARGVEEANDCEFIMFVDADDTITNNALGTLHSLTNDNIDIVFSAIDESYLPPKDNFTNKEYRHSAVKNEYYIGAACGKLIKRTLLDDFVFAIPDCIKVHEDTVMNIRIAFNAKNYISFCKKRIYNYRGNTESVMHTFKKDLEYERLLHEHVIASIPVHERDLYIKDTIPYRLTQWRKVYMYKYDVVDMKHEKFYKDLCCDIKKYKFQLKFFENILFHKTSPTIRFFAICMFKICNILNPR